VILLSILDVAYPDKDERARFPKASGEVLPKGGGGRASFRGLLCQAALTDEARNRGLRREPRLKMHPPGTRIAGQWARIRSQAAPVTGVDGATGFRTSRWCARLRAPPAPA
jgi:hypothetical protein